MAWPGPHLLLLLATAAAQQNWVQKHHESLSPNGNFQKVWANKPDWPKPKKMDEDELEVFREEHKNDRIIDIPEDVPGSNIQIMDDIGLSKLFGKGEVIIHLSCLSCLEQGQ